MKNNTNNLNKRPLYNEEERLEELRKIEQKDINYLIRANNLKQFILEEDSFSPDHRTPVFYEAASLYRETHNKIYFQPIPILNYKLREREIIAGCKQSNTFPDTSSSSAKKAKYSPK